MLLLSPKPFHEFTAKEFHDYVESLYMPGESKQSRLVDGVTLSKNKKGTDIVRVTRTNKCITRDEIKLLALEYAKDEMETLALFKTRKIEVIYDAGDARKEYDATLFKPEKPKTNVKRGKAGRKALRENKLLELKPNS